MGPLASNYYIFHIIDDITASDLFPGNKLPGKMEIQNYSEFLIVLSELFFKVYIKGFL